MDRRKLLFEIRRAISASSLARRDKRRLQAALTASPRFRREALAQAQIAAAGVDGFVADDGGWLDDIDWGALFDQILRLLVDLLLSLLDDFGG